MKSLSPEAQRILARAQEDQITHFDLHFTDVTGMVKAVQIPARQLETAFLQGIWFDGSAIEGFARIAESDMYLKPDPGTYALLPWEQDAQSGRRIGRLICDVYSPTGDPFPGDPRAVLRRALDMAKQVGFRYVVNPEMEFYLFRPPAEGQLPAVEDSASYFDVSDNESRAIRRVIADSLDAMGILIESGHHEIGGGQHELDFAPMDALQMADAVMTARLAVKSIARKYGLLATFMPKPLARAAGSGMHVHQVLVDISSGTNRFADASADYGLSAVGRMFIAGQLSHARGICAVLAPLVNSYKRLIAGHEAPVSVTWAQLNRSALIRVPRVTTDLINRVRVELRCVDPSCNPYLAFAVMVRAGLDGIASQMDLPAAAEEELYLLNARRRQIALLPTSLNEALAAMEQSELVSNALGLNVFERFLEAKRIEWNEYSLEISQWELDRYLRAY